MKTLGERLNVKLDKTGECWMWRGATNGRYGVIGTGHGHSRYTHRIAWELAYGPIPAGMKVCHQCDNPPCCRPDHLFLGTQADNLSDARQKGHLYEHVFTAQDQAKAALNNRNAKKTHCKHNHEFTPENTYIRSRGKRDCRQCHRESARKKPPQLATTTLGEIKFA